MTTYLVLQGLFNFFVNVSIEKVVKPIRKKDQLSIEQQTENISNPCIECLTVPVEEKARQKIYIYIFGQDVLKVHQ